VNAFSGRGGEHMDDLDPLSGPEVADAPIAAFRDWEHVSGERFADLTKIHQPTLVVNGVFSQTTITVQRLDFTCVAGSRRNLDKNARGARGALFALNPRSTSRDQTRRPGPTPKSPEGRATCRRPAA